MRRTRALAKVAAAIMADPDSRHYGYALQKQSGIRSGVMYPVLRRMHEQGWLADGREDQPDGRPPRRYYTVTASGRTALAEFAGMQATRREPE